MIKKNKIPTILGIVILLVGIFAGVFYLGMNQIFRIGASSETTPKDIRTGNINGNSVTISWTTDKKTSGFINWGESQNSIGNVEKESATDEKFFTHLVTITGLKPNTNYFYKINSDGTNFDNKGIPWEFTTGASLGLSTNSEVLSGSVISATGTPESRALVYANVGGYLLTTLTSDAGNFVFQLGNTRTQDLQSYEPIDPAKTLVEISVVSPDGLSSAQIFPQSGNPMPPIIIGQIYDFRNLSPQVDNQIPNANLNIPENATKSSKFSLPVITGTPTPTSVILESLKEGEIITSTKPSFFGRGPGGEQITITIQSNPITQTLTIAKDGTWTFNVPTDLAPGAHIITISWIDSLGITRTLSRNFIVQAGVVPAFEATPSQTLAPSTSPSSSPRPTTLPTVTPTILPSGTPEPVPVTGDLTPTILISIMGIAVMLFSFVVWKIAENQ